MEVEVVRRVGVDSHVLGLSFGDVGHDMSS